MSTDADRITVLEGLVKDQADRLAAALAALAAAPQPAPPPPIPPEPQRWADRAAPGDWTELMDWIDRLSMDYSLFGDYPILPCWPAHPGVVEELAGIWRAWISAVLADDAAGAGGSASLTAWHHQWLWPCLTRLKASHYSISSCRHRHEPGRTNRPVTDRFILAS